MLYTGEVAQAVHRVYKPVPISVHVVEFSDHLRLRIYENEIMHLSVEDRIKVMQFINTLEEVVRSFGVECVPEGVKGDPA